MITRNTYQVISQSKRDDIRPYKYYHKENFGSVLPRKSVKKLVIKNARQQKSNEESARKYTDSVSKKLTDALDLLFSRPLTDGKPDISGICFEELYKGVENLCRLGMEAELWDQLHKKMETSLQSMRKYLKNYCFDTFPKPDDFNKTQIIELGELFSSAWEEWLAKSELLKEIYSYLDNTYIRVSLKSCLHQKLVKLVTEAFVGENESDRPNFFEVIRQIIMALSNSESRKTERPENVIKLVEKLASILRQLSNKEHVNLLEFFKVDSAHHASLLAANFDPNSIEEVVAFLEAFMKLSSLGQAELSRFGSGPVFQQAYSSAIVHAYFGENFGKLWPFVWHLTKRSYSQHYLTLLQYSAFHAESEKLIIEYEKGMERDLNEVAEKLGPNPKLWLKEFYERQKRVWVTTSYEFYMCGRTYSEHLFETSLTSFDYGLYSVSESDRPIYLFMEKMHKDLKKKFSKMLMEAPWESKLAEKLAKCAEELVRSAPTDSEELEKTFDKSVHPIASLFKYIGSKDVFANVYTKDLARRLLQNKVSSMEAEKAFLSVLRAECSKSYTSKMDCMIEDISSSQEIQKNTKMKNLGNQMPEFMPTILTDGKWPNYAENYATGKLDCLGQMEQFGGIYSSMNPHRCLRWQPNLGYCTINGRFGTKIKELTLPYNLAVILLIFEDDKFHDVKEISKSTGLEYNDLYRYLHSLTYGKYKLLRKEPDVTSFDFGDKYIVNDDFTDKSSKLRITILGGKFEVPGCGFIEETKGEGKDKEDEKIDTPAELIISRDQEIQAALIRIIKAKTPISHTELIADTREAVKDRGKVLVTTIKKNIENLIKNAMIARGKDPKTYVYT